MVLQDTPKQYGGLKALVDITMLRWWGPSVKWGWYCGMGLSGWYVVGMEVGWWGGTLLVGCYAGLREMEVGDCIGGTVLRGVDAGEWCSVVWGWLVL